jgi:hypothetical protein
VTVPTALPFAIAVAEIFPDELLTVLLPVRFQVALNACPKIEGAETISNKMALINRPIGRRENIFLIGLNFLSALGCL